MARTAQDRIARLLLEKTALSEEQLAMAREFRRKKGGDLGRILIRQKAIQEADLLQVLAEDFQLDLVTLLPQTSDVSFVNKLPISFLKKNLLVPVKIKGESCIAINDPYDFQMLDDIRRKLAMNGCPVVLSTEKEIIRTINSAYDMAQQSAEQVIQDIDDEDADQLFSKIEEIEDLLDDTSDSPVIRLVNLMLSQAVRGGISDIHIEPQQRNVKIRQRLDGILYDMFTPPKHVQSALVSRIKLMAKMNIAEKRLPQDGRIEIKVGNKDIDIRVSTLPTAFGERVVLRLLDKSTIRLSLTDLGMSADRLELFSEHHQVTQRHRAGNRSDRIGQDDHLYAALSEINTTRHQHHYRGRSDRIPDPGIGQVQVNPKIDLTFASGLRSIVRQDPDVILIGEIRDLETAEIAIQSALTGHLVFSTLHTNDAPGTITRLRDMGLEPFLLASSINAVVAQRLVRVVCDSCRETYRPNPVELERIGIAPDRLKDGVVYRGRGCDDCLNTGYRGRTGIHEFLIMDDEIKKMILETADATMLRNHARPQGMKTLLEDGAEKVILGQTTIEEVYRVAQS